MACTQPVLFDLDGTFADTAPDLGYALNVRCKRAAATRCRSIGSAGGFEPGARGLLGLGFGLAPVMPTTAR